MASAPPSAATGLEVARRIFDRINARDLDALRTVWTADTVERFPDRTCRGADEIAAYFAGLAAAMPDFRFDVLHAAADGEDVLVRWHLTGTHTGERFAGIEPTGRRIE